MRAQVISIEPTSQSSQFQVAVAIANEKHLFTLTVETLAVASEKIQGIKGDRHFLEVFRFNQNLALEIHKLVLRVHNGETANLPADIGDFYPKEAELASI